MIKRELIRYKKLKIAKTKIRYKKLKIAKTKIAVRGCAIKSCPEEFHKVYRKAPVLESCNKVAGFRLVAGYFSENPFLRLPIGGCY